MRRKASIVYENQIASAIVGVIIGAILLALGVVILTDFFELMETSTEGAVANQTALEEPLSTAFGLGAIALVVPIVGAVVGVLMGSFGGLLGRNGGNGGR